MSATRPDPFSMLLAGPAEEPFAAIREAIGSGADRDAFLLSIPALELLEQLRPEEGSGEQIDELVNLVYAAWRFWDADRPIQALDEAATRAIVTEQPDPSDFGPTASGAWYIQVAERIIWGRPTGEGAFEPLDGCFVVTGDPGLLVVGCFGLHPERPGLSVATASGKVPERLARRDGSPLFAPVMPGGAEARLHAITSPDELLLLGWRALTARERD